MNVLVSPSPFPFPAAGWARSPSHDPGDRPGRTPLSCYGSWDFFAGGTSKPAGTSASAHTWACWEHVLHSTRHYGNPYADVTLRVNYTGQTAAPLQAYGFCDVKKLPDSLRLPRGGLLRRETGMLRHDQHGIAPAAAAAWTSHRIRATIRCTGMAFSKVSANPRVPWLMATALPSCGSATPPGPFLKSQ